MNNNKLDYKQPQQRALFLSDIQMVQKQDSIKMFHFRCDLVLDDLYSMIIFAYIRNSQCLYFWILNHSHSHSIVDKAAAL